MQIGVLALQGAFREHRLMLESLGCSVREVRLPKHLEGLDGVIFPGGESTTIGKLMVHYGFIRALREYHQKGGAIFATCAGAILLATEITESEQPHLDLLEMRVRRNAFGRQVDSFEVLLEVKGLAQPFPAVFIRAPIIESVGTGVQILARYHDQIVLVQKNRLLASSFHPELTNDPRLHQYFLDHVVLA
ncbi:MAG: pyridoxal 5'-phosphate synthase glutaminase subunit PdxT [Deinococcales bacterium]